MELTLEKIKFKTKEEKPCQVTFSVQIPSDIVEAKQKEVTKEFQREAQLPGFRVGKAPLELIQKNFADKLKSHTVDQLLKESVPHVLREKEIIPLFTPMVDQINLDAKQVLSFTLVIERNPNFKVKSFKNIPVEKKVKKITDADVQKELDTLRERNAQLAPAKATKLEKTHFAVIDFAGSLDGKLLPNMKAENQLIDCASPQTIQGFAEGILGLTVGETKEISVPFPATHPNKDLAGKNVIFKVALREIKEKVLPNLDDELAKDLGVASLTDLKTAIQNSLQKTADEATQTQIENQICDHLVKENNIPLPNTLVSVQLSSMVNQALKKEFGPKAEKEDLEPEIKEKKESLIKELKVPAEKAVRLSYLIGAITREEKLAATEEDWTAELEVTKKNYPAQLAQIEKSFIENKEKILRRLTESKTFKFLVDKAKIKEVA